LTLTATGGAPARSDNCGPFSAETAPPQQLQLRATDAYRDRVAQVLPAAAAEGAVTVDELEQHLGSA